MSFQDDQEFSFLPRQLSSASSEEHSSSDDGISNSFSSGSDYIPPHPTQSPPPPPPFQTPIPPPFQFTDPLPPVRFSPEHIPRARVGFQPQHPIIPPPPPPPRAFLSSRPTLHKVLPTREEVEQSHQRLQTTTMRLTHSHTQPLATRRSPKPSRPGHLPRQISQPQPLIRPSPQPSPQPLRPSQLVLQRHHQLHHQHSYQGPLPLSMQTQSHTHAQNQVPQTPSLLSQAQSTHSTLPTHSKSFDTPLSDLQSQKVAITFIVCFVMSLQLDVMDVVTLPCVM